MEDISKKFQEAERDQEMKNSNPDYVFKESRKYIEKALGIELTLIELVRLKELSYETTKRFRSNITSNSSYKVEPTSEAQEIFLNNYYGIPFTFDVNGKIKSNNWIPGRYEFLDQNGYDGYKEFWKRKQKEAHFP